MAGNSGNGGDGGDTTIVDLGISAGGGKGGNSTGNSAGGTPGAPSVGTIFQWSGKVAGGRSAPWAVWVERLTAVMVVFLTSVHLEMMVSFPVAAVLVHRMIQWPGASGKGANSYVIIEELA